MLIRNRTLTASMRHSASSAVAFGPTLNDSPMARALPYPHMGRVELLFREDTMLTITCNGITYRVVASEADLFVWATWLKAQLAAAHQAA